VPQKGGAVVEYGGNSGGTPRGIVLPEESVDAAVRRVEASVQDTVQAIALIDRCMAQIKCDPYYNILEMLYFEGRTQEDIAMTFGCSQVAISKNKSRLVRELAMRLFPNQTVNELMN
jgi:DNA-directed RNA polymerase specialized sigma24 family protein